MALDQDQEPPKKKQKRPIKPLPDKLAALTKEQAAEGLRFREEKDTMAGSVTHNAMVKVAYGVQISENSKDYFFPLDDLNVEQLRRFCRQLGITGNAKHCRFHCRRALYAYFTKDPVDFSLLPFLKSMKWTGSPIVPRQSSETTSPAAVVGLEPSPPTVPAVPGTNNHDTCVAAPVPPLLTETTTDTNNNQESSHEHDETSVSPSNTDGDQISRPELNAWLLRIKQCPHPDDDVVDTSNQPPGARSRSENPDDGSSQQPSSDDSGGTSRRSSSSESLQHPVRIKTEFLEEDMDPHVHHHHHHHHSNESSVDQNDVETVAVPTFVSETDTNESSNAGDIDASGHPSLPLLLENHDSDPDTTERETRDQPFPWIENNDDDSTEEEEIETSSTLTSVQDPPDLSENDNESPVTVDPVDQSSHHATTNIEGRNPQIPDETSLQDMLQKTSQMILDKVQKSLDALHTIRDDDLALKKQELALRKQELLWKKKSHLQDTMNQTLQNYMNPACPPEFKATLLEQWKGMDVELKTLEQDK